MHFKSKTIPLAYIVVADHCNSKCITCSYWKNDNKNISNGNIEKITKSLSSYKVSNLIITGGEPLLNRNISLIAKKINEEIKPIKLSLMTNGILLNKCETSFLCLFDRIVISIDSFSQSNYKKIRGVDLLEKVTNNIKKTKESLNIEIKIKCTIQKHNYNEIESIIELAQHSQVDSISFISVDSDNSDVFAREDEESLPRLALNQEELSELEAIIKRLSSDKPKLFQEKFIMESPESLLENLVYRPLSRLRGNTNKPNCNALESTVIFEANGNVKHCFFTPSTGSISNQSLQEIIDSPAYSEQLSSFEKKSLKHCEGCICPYTIDYEKSLEGSMPER